jgi:hypothetical protein
MTNVTFDFDPAKIFHMLKEDRTLQDVLGSTLVETLLQGGETSFRDDIRLELFGVRVVKD